MQFDPAFWLADSPAAVGAALNALTGMDLIDAAVREAARREREAAAEVKVLRGQREALAAEVKSLAWVPKAVKAREAMLKLGWESAELEEQAAELAAFFALPPVVKVPDIGPLKAVRAEADTMADEWAGLSQGLDELDKLQEQLCELEAEAKGLAGRLRKHAGRGCPVCGGKLNPLAPASPY